LICDFVVQFSSPEAREAGTPEWLTLSIVKEHVGTVNVTFQKGPELDALYRALRRLEEVQ
jgi:hypothetical protein